MGEKKLLILFLLLMVCLPAPAWAELSLEAKLDKNTLTADDTLTYELTVNSSGRKIPVPQLPDFKGFRVLSQGQSSSISFSAGQVKNTTVYAFILAPLETGKLKIAPSTIKAADKVYSSDAFEVSVAPGKAKPRPGQSPAPPQQKHPPSDTGAEKPRITL